MSNKDRIAILISAFYALALPYLVTDIETIIVLLIPVVLYWCYRVIKKDISFTGKSEDRA